ncbi:MAG: anthranilate synthase component I family protein [Bacteroidales bacterium]|nr:anthranilate synthase component I family protein [Bacteroidales bacterium]
MRKTLSIRLDNVDLFKKKLISFSNILDRALVLDSFDYKINHNIFHKYEFLAGLGVIKDFKSCTTNIFHELREFHSNYKDWLFGNFNYDLKNKIEKLESTHPDFINFPEISFFVPEWVLVINSNILSIIYPKQYTENKAISLIEEIQKTTIEKFKPKLIDFKPRFSKRDYLSAVGKIKNHIQAGDIYEMNFCQEFYSNKSKIDPYSTFNKLSDISPAPFSAFYKLKDKFLISASPERFLQKTGNNIVSQPIKGTCKRGKNEKEDRELAALLKNDIKEKSENVMIVDLVRNDLSKTAKKGSVRVSELFGIYKFPQVFQMISTVESELRKDLHFTDLIKGCFPMGSMTGAPKIRAMEIIEQYERTKRGLYSGSVGYISPEGDFDFNVVIRSLQYNQANSYLSYIVGGAITNKSIAENEYNECILKAEALKGLFI